jgi:hypothetical protein
MKIRNINGTSENVCECGSWLEHWKKFSGQSFPVYCPEKVCTNKPEVGAHVQKDNSTDKGWYIVPLCSKCNGKTGESLEISDNVKLVSANVSETCGKS